MSGEGQHRADNDPVVDWIGSPVVVTDTRGVRWVGKLRRRTYSFLLLDEDLILSRDKIIAISRRDRPGP